MSDFCIDYREHELLAFFQPKQAETPFIKSSKYTPIVQNLTVGDIVIGTDASGTPQKGSLVVERKAVADFEASFLDGRYRDQRTRLLTFCQESGANVAYVLEGSLDSLRRLQPAAARKLLTRLQLHYKIPIFQTKSPQDTADLVACWIEQWRESPESFGVRDSQITLADTVHVSRKQNLDNPRAFAAASLANCQGVSVKMAEEILGNFKTWGDLLAVSVEDLANFKQANGRKIGPAVAGRLHTLLHSPF